MRLTALLVCLVILMTLGVVCMSVMKDGYYNNEQANVIAYRVHVDHTGPEPILVLDAMTAIYARHLGAGKYAHDTLTVASFDTVRVFGEGMFNQVMFEKTDSGINWEHADVYLALGHWQTMQSQERK